MCVTYAGPQAVYVLAKCQAFQQAQSWALIPTNGARMPDRSVPPRAARHAATNLAFTHAHRRCCLCVCAAVVWTGRK